MSSGSITGLGTDGLGDRPQEDAVTARLELLGREFAIPDDLRPDQGSEYERIYSSGPAGESRAEWNLRELLKLNDCLYFPGYTNGLLFSDPDREFGGYQRITGKLDRMLHRMEGAIPNTVARTCGYEFAAKLMTDGDREKAIKSFLTLAFISGQQQQFVATGEQLNCIWLVMGPWHQERQKVRSRTLLAMGQKKGKAVMRRAYFAGVAEAKASGKQTGAAGFAKVKGTTYLGL